MKPQQWIYPVVALAPLVSLACTPHVAVDPIKVEPIQVDVNLNLKVVLAVSSAVILLFWVLPAPLRSAADVAARSLF